MPYKLSNTSSDIYSAAVLKFQIFFLSRRTIKTKKVSLLSSRILSNQTISRLPTYPYLFMSAEPHGPGLCTKVRLEPLKIQQIGKKGKLSSTNKYKHILYTDSFFRCHFPV